MTDTLVIARQEADSQFATAVEWWGLVEDFDIETDEQQEEVAVILRDVKDRYRVLEEKRKEITVPLNAALRAVNNLFRPPREKFEALEHLLKGKITEYLARKAQENVAALQAAAVAKTSEEATEALATIAPVAPPQGVSVRQVWKFEVTDPDLVPRHLCSPDMKKISDELGKKADKYGQPDLIPGVRVYQEAVVAARSR